MAAGRKVCLGDVGCDQSAPAEAAITGVGGLVRAHRIAIQRHIHCLNGAEIIVAGATEISYRAGAGKLNSSVSDSPSSSSTVRKHDAAARAIPTVHPENVIRLSRFRERIYHRSAPARQPL